MWAIRILSGPQAGQIFPLTAGNHRLGRAPSCEVKINSNSVSKEHAVILVTSDKAILTDNNSRNGTFVNGVRVQSQRLNLGDKIGLHDILFDVIRIPDQMNVGNQPIRPQGGVYSAPPPAWAGSAAKQLEHAYHPQHGPYPHSGAHSHMDEEEAQHAGPPQAKMSAASLSAVFYNFQIYIDNVAMPGIYSLVKSMPFRYAVGALVSIYVVIVTALSTIPVVNTTKQNIRMESMRRAKTIAKNMAVNNTRAVINDNEMALDIRQAELEEGVTTAVILRAKDGTIMAPASKRGEFVNKPFVNKARREEKEVADYIDDSSLGVSIPIKAYTPENGNQSVIGYAIILYDMGALAMNASQTFSLFIQTLAIALLIGFLLYYFLYKIFENPIEVLNVNLDDALREGRDDLTTDYQLPPLERLVANINSALSRIDRSSGAQDAQVVVNRDTEAANLMKMLYAPALVVNAIDERVIASNMAFDGLVGGGVNLTGQPLTSIPDVALQENLRDLIPLMRASVMEVATSEIPFAGSKYEIAGHAILSGNEPAYYLIVINPTENQ